MMGPGKTGDASSEMTWHRQHSREQACSVPEWLSGRLSAAVERRLACPAWARSIHCAAAGHSAYELPHGQLPIFIAQRLRSFCQQTL